MTQELKTYQQYELENNSQVEFIDGSFATFLKMDGLYAKWDYKGHLRTGNFSLFIKTPKGYKVYEQ